METFISEHDIRARIKTHPDFSKTERDAIIDRYCIVEQQDKTPRSYNTRQTNNGKKRLQPTTDR